MFIDLWYMLPRRSSAGFERNAIEMGAGHKDMEAEVCSD